MKRGVRNVFCKVLVLALGAFLAGSVGARTFEFKALGSNGALTGGNSGIRNSWESGSSSMTTAQSFAIRVGSALKTDSMDKMEIRAATLMRNISNKNIAINDIATLVFEPINQGKSINFKVMTGTAKKDNYGGRAYSGWQVVGCIIELWQKGKVVKHWTNCAGMVGKTHLTEDVRQMKLGSNGYSRSSSFDSFDNPTTIFPITPKGVKVSLDELLGEFRKDDQVQVLKAAAAPKLEFDASRPMKYAIRKSDRVTAEDRRIVLEDLREPASFENNFGNIVVRKFTSQEELDDFKLVNPKGMVFNTLAELKAFMRTVEIAEDSNGQEVLPRRRRRGVQPPVVQEEPEDKPVQEPVAPVKTEPAPDDEPAANPVKRTKPQRELTDEERLLIELKHDEEMLKRKIKQQKNGQPR